MLVEVEAKEAGEQLAGGSPPDKEGQDAAEEGRREQATQGPSDLGCCLLSLILPGTYCTIVHCCQHCRLWEGWAQAPGVAT